MANEDKARWAIPSVHVQDDEKIQAPYQEPVPPGGALPQLDLARADGIDAASGQAFQSMPTPEKPEITWPELNGSPECGGYESTNPSPAAPDLACFANRVDYSPASGPIAPDHAMPDFASLNKSIRPYNIDAGMDFIPGGEFAPDPDLPDLTAYNKPMGMDFYPTSYNNLWAPDPSLDGDATNSDIPGGIAVFDHPLDPDPPVPDLQSPQIEPDVRMQPEDRPGDMAPGAMGILHGNTDYGATKGVAYDLSYMTQPGSSNRSRRMDRLNHGLDGDM